MRTHNQSGGVATDTTAVDALNASFPVKFNQLLDWEGDDEGLGLDLDFEVNLPSLQQGFPPGVVAVQPRPVFNAGASANGVAWNNTPALIVGPCGVLKLELLNAQGARTLYCDIKSCRYSLGSFGRVRVSYAFWGTTLGAFAVELKASVVTAGLETPNLRFSALKAFLPGENFTLGVPPGAFNMDVWAGLASNYGTGAAPIISMRPIDNGPGLQRDFSSGLYIPPYKAPANYGDILNVTASAGDPAGYNVLVQFEIA